MGRLGWLFSVQSKAGGIRNIPENVFIDKSIATGESSYT